MSAINGKYMYNLTTGETIGIRKSKVTEEDGLTGKEKTRGIFNSDSEDSSGGWVDYYMLGNNDVSSASGIQYGSVEDLNFPQLIDLFLSGNLVPDELKVGLESKGATNIKIQNNGNMVVVTFSYENKEYTLNCAADAAVSQVDNITVDDYENNISVTSEGCRVYENWDGQIRGQGAGERIQLTLWNNGSGFEESYSLLNIKDTLGPNGLDIVNEHPIAEIFIEQFFGVSDIDDLTDEQIKFVNDHPEIFHLTNFSKGGCAYDASMTQMVIDTFFGTDLWLSPEELYCGRIETFKSSIESKNTKGYYGVINQMQLDGNTVSWNDDTVSYILDYLKSPAPFGDEQKKKYVMDLYGFNANDDAETIKQKLQKFFKANGSADGKSMHIEDYYLSTKVAIARMEGDNFPYTYEEIVKQQEEFLNKVRTESSQEQSSYPAYDGVDLIAFIQEYYNNGSSEFNMPTIEPVDITNFGGTNRRSGEDTDSSVNGDSYTVNEGEYGSELVLTLDNGIDYGSVTPVSATVIPADDYIRQPGESDEEYSVNRWKRIAENMMKAFPDLGYDLEYYLDQMGDFAKFDYLDSGFPLNFLVEDAEGRGSFWAVLEFAAGIKSSDSNKTKGEKYKAIFNKFGSVGADGTCYGSMVSMLQYLAGKNSEGVNYFAIMIKINDAVTEKEGLTLDDIKNYSSDNGDPSIEVEEVSANNTIQHPTDSEREISQYMGEQLRAIYARYYARMHDEHLFKYFEVNPSGDTNGNIDSSKYQTEYLTWKNEEDRQAFWSAIQDVINDVMAKYGDSISGIYFNGDQPYIILKNGKELTGLVGGSYNDYIPDDLRAEGYDMVPPLTGGLYQDVTDHPVLVADNIEIYENDNIPDKAPVDKNGDAMIPTQWPGIYVSKEGKVYAWDSVNNKYKGINSGVSGQDLLRGNSAELTQSYLHNLSPDEYDLIIPLLFGLKRTNYQNVYADENGKFYRLTSATSGEYRLAEIDVIEPRGGNGKGGTQNAPGMDDPAIEDDDETPPPADDDVDDSETTLPSDDGVDDGDGTNAPGMDDPAIEGDDNTTQPEDDGEGNGGTGAPGMDDPEIEGDDETPPPADDGADDPVTPPVNPAPATTPKTTAKDKDSLMSDIINKHQKALSAYSGASVQFAAVVSSLIDSFLNGEISEAEFNKLVESMFNEILSSAKEGKEAFEETITEDDYTKKRDELARKLGLIETQTGSCIYYGMNADGSRSYYIYDPEQGKFVEFDRTESDEKTQEQLKQNAIVKAQKMGLSYTANYPWVCRKGDSLYRYDPATGEYVKFYTAYKSNKDEEKE